MKILDLLNEYFGTESENLDEFDEDFGNQNDECLPEPIYRFLKFVQRKENNNL